LRRAYQAFLEQDYAAALELLDRLATSPGVRPEIACLRAAVLLQQERLDEAEVACQEVLACDPWHADAHFLMGFISRLRDEVEDAVQSLKQTIYLQPDHREAHFFLAEIYRALGLRRDARREYENTLNILKSRAGQPSTPGLTGLPDDTLRRACESNLGNL
jgi:tetratricopeptide (TPR) repeat protein